jgi:predicted dinucleotide-binding enzyme
MRIGIIGAGHIGGTVSRHFRRPPATQIGLDPVDAGTLAEGGRRHEFGTSVFAADVPTEELPARLAD